LGQQAAEQYAELQLRRHDYAAALQIADESAGPRGDETRESKGAELVGRILRMLFVEPATAALPDPPERIALYLRYGGYVMPGEKGDDVRLAAARLMLDQGVPHPVLDTLQQLSDSAAADPDVARMRAAAEAEGGDPARALELVRGLPDDIAARRIAATANDKLNKPVPAAHLLDDATEIADRARRANLLFEGEAWKDAAAAYATLLNDASLPTGLRDDMAKRYAIAVAMAGGPAPASPPGLPEGPVRMLAALPPPPAQKPASPTSTGGAIDTAALRGALERAKAIETLLGSQPGHQGS
jgi:hypothetical protein